jgi:hypothetical protein
MLKYEKMREYMYGKLGCKFFDLFDQGGVLKYVRFQTRMGTDCLLEITRPMNYPTNHSKLVPLTPWMSNQKDDFDFIVSETTDLVKKVSNNLSPEGYLHFLDRLKPSLISTPYSVAVMTSEYLIVGPDIYHIKDVSIPTTRLLIVVKLETLIERNVTPEIQRVNDNIIEILEESTIKFKSRLRTVLTKCSDMKILSNKMSQLEDVNPVDRNILIFESQHALELATDAIRKIDL